VEKRPVLKAATPGGHWTIRLTWLVAFAALLTAAALLLLGSDAALGLALTAAIVFVVALVAYLIRHQRFLSRLTRAEALVAADDLAAARSLVSPLMDRFPGIAAVQRVAGLVLYASGDPLSAASLLERSRAVDATAIVALVASYAALNKAGDARRAAERSPDHPDVTLALAWAELVATGGDRERGAELAHALGNGTPSRAAMAGTLRAIAAARRGDADGMQDQLRAAEARRTELSPSVRAFIGYLGGIALRESGALDDARATFTIAIETAPDTIGEALARRERAHIPASSASVQPSSD